MWKYEKKLLYPVRVRNKNPRLAQIILSQYGGPDGELAASLRYLSQRFAMPTVQTQGLLNDIGLCVMILLLYAKIGKAYCFQYAMPFSLYHFKT